MGRGIVSGAIWGAIASVLILAVASLLAGQPAGNAPPEAPQVAAPEAGMVAEPGAAPETETPAVSAEETSGETPEVAVAPEVEASAPRADTEPGPAPVAGEIADHLAAPEAGNAPDLAGSGETPVLPNPQSRVPQAPGAEETASISSDPAQPAAPEIETAEALPDPDEEIAAVEEPPVAVADPVVAAEDPAGGAVADPETSAEEASAAESAPPGAPDAAEVAPETAQVAEADTGAEPGAVPPEAEPESAATPDEAPETETAENVTPEPAETESAAPATETADAETTESEPAMPRVALAGEESGLPGADTGVVVRRLGGQTPEPTPAPEETDEVLTVEELPDDAPALVRYAETFENAAGLPTMAIVIVDDGSLDGAVTALGGLPFPVSVGVDPGRSGAAESAAAYRAAGFEVVAVPTLPEGASPSDVEVTLGAAFETLPEAVALLDAGEAGLRGPGAVAAQAMAALAAEGRGFVTVSQGLNAPLRAAEAAEVPSAVILRDLDGDGQEARVIRRFLDQAAFRARQESGVVMLARARPDTISALILWGTANRRGQVALVPVSAILRGE